MLSICCGPQVDHFQVTYDVWKSVVLKKHAKNTAVSSGGGVSSGSG